MIPGLCNLFQSLPGAGGGMNITATPNYVFTLGNGLTTSALVTATVTGGTAPYTYSWDFVTGDSSVSADFPTNSATTFSVTLNPLDQVFAYFRCTVTDSATNTATSNQVLLDFQAN